MIAKGMTLPNLTHLAISGATIAVRATPKASANRIVPDGGVLRVYVTAAPDKGRANAAIIKLLAKSLGIPKTRVTLIRGETGRDKVFRVG